LIQGHPVTTEQHHSESRIGCSKVHERTSVYLDIIDSAEQSLEHHPTRHTVYANVDRIRVRGVLAREISLGQLEMHRSFPRLSRDSVLDD
jgi:hypothetical protein